MSYQTGTATGPNDLLDKIRTFLEADGWTTNLFAAVGAGYRLHVQKTAGDGSVMYFNFRSAIAETGTTLIAPNNIGSTSGTVTGGILINGSTGYDGGELWHSQPGFPTNPQDSNKGFAGCINPMSISAIPAYYIFSVDDSVHVIVEGTSGLFQFMSFGLLEKQGIYTGGQYFSASYGSSAPYLMYNGVNYYSYKPYYFSFNDNTSYNGLTGAIYVDADSTADWRVAGPQTTYAEIVFPCPSPSIAYATNTLTGLVSLYYTKSPNFYNNIATMCPIYTLLKRSDNNYSLLGWPSGVRFLNVINYSAGQELTYGSETWKVFPNNDIGVGTIQNANCGFAFKKVI